MFRTLLLVSEDNAFAAPIPDQTAGLHVWLERPVEVGQVLEEVDEFLVCSCRFFGYGGISRRDMWSIALINNFMIVNLVL